MLIGACRVRHVIDLCQALKIDATKKQREELETNGKLASLALGIIEQCQVSVYH